MESIKDKIEEIVEGYAECRWLDAGELEIYLNEVVTEQKKIDIDKACDEFCNRCPNYVDDTIGLQGCAKLGCDVIRDFRKAMEE